MSIVTLSLMVWSCFYLCYCNSLQHQRLRGGVNLQWLVSFGGSLLASYQPKQRRHFRPTLDRFPLLVDLPGWYVSYRKYQLLL
jgi:hypothetical protein